MAKSAALRTKDHLNIWRILGECGELGDDPHLWWLHLGQETRKLVDADFCSAGELVAATQTNCDAAGFSVDAGWESGMSQDAWFRLQRRLEASSDFAPMWQPYMNLRATNDGLAVTRRDLVSDHDWYTSEYYRDYHSDVGCDHTLYSYRGVDVDPMATAGLVLARLNRRRDFHPREKMIAQELFRSITGRLGNKLARYQEPSPMKLPPRPRMVLKLMLEGESDKRIATKLGISSFTVNEYTKVIYRHFYVNGRSELLARWIKRGWSAHAKWTED